MYISERIGETSLVGNVRYITGCPQLTLEKGLRDCSTHQKTIFQKELDLRKIPERDKDYRLLEYFINGDCRAKQSLTEKRN